MTQVSETIIIHGQAGEVDDFGYPTGGTPDRELVVREIQPLELTELSEVDQRGVKDALRVWCHPGAVGVQAGDDVTIRGLRYQVVTTPWDWSVGRRPRLARHKPGTVFDCVRRAG